MSDTYREQVAAWEESVRERVRQGLPPVEPLRKPSDEYPVSLLGGLLVCLLVYWGMSVAYRAAVSIPTEPIRREADMRVQRARAGSVREWERVERSVKEFFSRRFYVAADDSESDPDS